MGYLAIQFVGAAVYWAFY